MAFLSSFLKELGTGDQVRDWQHASKLFVGDNFRLSPKYGFLFHVAFDVNQAAIAGSQSVTKPDSMKKIELGMLVKSASLPKFNVDTKVMNAYNRPNIVQNKISFDPVNITFHDDSADVVRNFWYDYYSYYYRTSTHNQEVFNSAHKYKKRQTVDWGYTIKGDDYQLDTFEPYLRAIRIYSMHQRRFSEYTLVNPIIKSFAHGEHSHEDSGLMTHSMAIEYETVLYADGAVSQNTVNGFADIHYDRGPSPLTAAGGGTNSILGQGGILDAADDVVRQLGAGNIGGALFTGYRAFQKNKGADLKQMAITEAITAGKDILAGNNPLAKIQVPSLTGALSGIFGGTQAPAPVVTAVASSPSANGQSKATSHGDSVGASATTTPSNHSPSVAGVETSPLPSNNIDPGIPI